MQLGKNILNLMPPLQQMIVRWTEIVGENNRKIMLPYELRGAYLFIAVPNPMVKSHLAAIKQRIAERINSYIKGVRIIEIHVNVKPEMFKQETGHGDGRSRITPDRQAIKRAAERLIREGITPERAYIMAEIEVLFAANNNTH